MISTKKNRKYEVEIWWQGKTKVAEIGRLLNSFKWTETRNGVGAIDFNIDQGALMDYCNTINEEPSTLLQIKNTDVKIKRYGEYRMGGFVNDFPDPNFNQSNSTMSISCDGYLNLLADQVIRDAKRYDQWYTTDIAGNLIEYANQKSGSNLGIQISGENYFNTGIKRDRTYNNQQIVKDAVVALTSLGDGLHDFDFRFTPFRVWETFDASIPIVHDMTIIYPAPSKTLTNQAGALSMSVGLVSDMANYIIVKGSGSGDVTPTAIAQDAESINQYGVHEAVISYSDISQVSTLQQYADAELAIRKQPVFLPKPKVSGAEFNVGKIHAGDVIRVVNNKSPWFHFDGLYRIEEMAVSVDSEGGEDVDLTLSDIGLNQELKIND